ncbi:728_t:CDS:2 [Entrophospora sp. SA101]|nr:728_t:CDS:2 [Entrophospora sp. SA101]
MLSFPRYKLIWDDGKSREYQIIRELTSGNGRRRDDDDNIGGVVAPISSAIVDESFSTKSLNSTSIDYLILS